MPDQKVAGVPSASESRSDMSAEMPALPFSTRDSLVVKINMSETELGV
jgi:hypothetical protein